MASDIDLSSAGEDRIARRKNRHLQLALRTVSEAWFPADPELHAELLSNLKSGAYAGDTSQFFNDLKKDSSLFLYCVRELARLLRTSSSCETDSAFGALRRVPLEKFIEILDVDSKKISQHSLSGGSRHQAIQMQHAVISASVAEALAAPQKINVNLAHGCALFRQLGLTLIAWNYPHVFKRVMTSLTVDKSLDEELGTMLGFSPTMLGATIAQEWGFSEQFQSALGVPVGGDEALSVPTASTLAKLCEIGEAFARASNPDIFPTAHADWDYAKKEITKSLGAEALQSLQEKIGASLQHYSKLAPHLFAFHPRSTGGAAAKAAPTVSRIQANLYLKHCPKKLQDRITELYSRIEARTVSKDAVDILTKQIIPDAGFVRGCIYLLEPESFKLVPRLAIGEKPLQAYKAANYANYSAEYDPIGTAYRSGAPILEEDALIFGETVSYVAGVLGETQKAGVLYLEMTPALSKNAEVSPLIVYKAVRQTLADCLSLQ